MPKAIVADWEACKALFIKGAPLPRIAELQGVPYNALRQRAHREKWGALVAKTETKVQQSVTMDLEKAAKEYVSRIVGLGFRVLDSLEAKKVFTFDDCERIASILSKHDPVQRRALGMETGEGGAKHSTLVQVVVAQPGAALPVQYEEQAGPQPGQSTIDVEAVSSAERSAQ